MANDALFVTDSNLRVRKVTTAGVTSPFVGSGASASTDGVGTAASFTYPYGIGADTDGTLYVADSYSPKVKKVTTAGANIILPFVSMCIQLLPCRSGECTYWKRYCGLC